jgi:hypothetical protein
MEWINKRYKVFILVLGAASLAFSCFIMYKASISGLKLFSVSLIAIFAGMLYESFRILDHWKTVLAVFITAYFISLFAFVPGGENHIYGFEDRIEAWPYWFLAVYSIGFAALYSEKPSAKLTEGITLLQSIALIYWIFDDNLIRYDNWFAIALLTIVLLFFAFSVLHALTYIRLSETMRIILSTWSSIIMLVLAIDNLISVFNSPEIESTRYLSEGFSIVLQYFFLGVSSLYAVYNFMLLAMLYLPEKGKRYSESFQEHKKIHLLRYLDSQVFIGHALLGIVYSSILYGLNYTFQLLPRNTVIWLVFFTFPILLNLIVAVQGKLYPKG